MTSEPALPPPSWHRRVIPDSVKVKALLLQMGLDPAKVEFHHQPALSTRPWSKITGDFDPPELSPAHIVAMATEAHRERTAKIDIPAAAKTARRAKAQAAHHEAMQITDAPTRQEKRSKWGRGRKMQSRSTFQKRRA